MFRKPNSASGHFTHGNVKQIHPTTIDNISQAVELADINTKPSENIFKRRINPIKKNRLKFQRDD